MILLKGLGLTVQEAWRGIDGEEVALAPEAREAILRSRELVERMVRQERPVYGITTGLGHLATVAVSATEADRLQENLVRSHAAGVGPPLERKAVRAMLLLRANTLAKGHSGIRLVVLERLLAFLNAGLHPVVPSQGSVGASGDLAPLAHLALALMGEGRAERSGAVLPAAEHLKALGLEPIRLTAKEGIALTNGTQMMAGLGLLALREAYRQIRAANLAGALTFQALRGIPAAFDHDLLMLRPHPGALRVGAELRDLLEGSRLVTQPGEKRVQDAYSLRCMPQVHGAVLQAASHLEEVLTVEMNAATDNPLLFPERGVALSGGNFHGQPVAFALDYLATALTALGAVSERRVERLVNPQISDLPPFLTRRPGVCSGLMLAQYTAAALASANKPLAHPASADSIPTSAGQEDFVSMGAAAATKLLVISRNLWRILGIEAVAACQAADLVGAEGLSPKTGAFHRRFRTEVPFYEDGVLGPLLERGGEVLRAFVQEEEG